MATGRELDYDRNASAMEMAELIFGDGINITPRHIRRRSQLIRHL